MYYEEKWIKGRLMFRHTPNGEWKEFTTTMYANELIGEKKEHDRLLRYIAYLQEKCDTIHWAYNKYDRWCEINDKH